MTGKTGNRLSVKVRKEIVAFANDLIESGGTRDLVTEMVRKKFGLKNTNSASVALAKNGVIFKEANRVTSVNRNAEKRAQEQLEILERRPIIFETQDHLYYRAARKLVERGINADVKDGVCRVNGYPVPWRRFVVDLAKMELPQ